MRRYAIVRGARSGDEVRAYLPDNYRLDGVAFEERATARSANAPSGTRDVYVISGVDDAGWTLDAYVLPRLWSGNMPGEEIDLSHPVMKTIPNWSGNETEGYELDDPKHPDYHSIHADISDNREEF